MQSPLNALSLSAVISLAGAPPCTQDKRAAAAVAGGTAKDGLLSKFRIQGFSIAVKITRYQCPPMLQVSKSCSVVHENKSVRRMRSN